MIAPLARYSLLCALVLGGSALLAAQGTRLGLGPALLLLPLAGWPCWLALAHAAAVRAAQRRAILREGARPWWGPLLGGALLRQALAVPVAVMAAASTGWWLLAEGWAGLAWIGAAAALLWPAARLLARQTGDLRPYARLRPVLLLAPPLVAAGLTLAWFLLAGAQALGEGTLAERVGAEPRYAGASALMAWAVDGMAVLSGARAWALAWAEGESGALAPLWRTVATFGQFWLLGGVFAGLLLPAGEARRILRPSDADVAPPAGAGRVGLAGFLLAILMGAAVSAAAEAEAWASARARPLALVEAPGLVTPGGPGAAPALGGGTEAGPAPAAPGLPTPTGFREAVEAERIGALLCPEGTIAGVEAIDRETAALLEARRGEVVAAARQGFDAVRARVPQFLDGYYSLNAEYVRTFHLVAGDAEAFLQEEMTAALGVEAAFGPFRRAAEALSAPLPEETVAARERLVASCGLLPSDGTMLRVTQVRAEALLRAVEDADTIGLRTRLAAGGVGLFAGGVAGAIVAKLVAKEAFGLAAEAVAKLAVAKAAGGLGGAAAGAGAGALAGSVVPGIGTTVGAAVGGVIGGLALGVATDYALIRIEEAVSREAFAAEILAAIDEAEAELLAGLLGPAAPIQ